MVVDLKVTVMKQISSRINHFLKKSTWHRSFEIFVPDSFWHNDLFSYFSIHIKNQREVRLKATDSEEAIHKGSHKALKENG